MSGNECLSFPRRSANGRSMGRLMTSLGGRQFLIKRSQKLLNRKSFLFDRSLNGCRCTACRSFRALPVNLSMKQRKRHKKGRQVSSSMVSTPWMETWKLRGREPGKVPFSAPWPVPQIRINKDDPKSVSFCRSADQITFCNNSGIFKQRT
jgi:hypothetical protein